MPKFAYEANSLDAALLDVQNGMSKKAASKKHGVPRSTVQFRLSAKFSKKELGPSPILTIEEEDILEKWVNDCSKKGFPRRKEDLQISVQEFLNQNERPNPFKNNLPGLGWYHAFLRRHPNISLRTPEGVTAASSCVSKNDIKNWFKNIEHVLKEENALEILKGPTRIFNGDETNFLLCPKGSKVLALKGSKNVYEIDKGQSKAAVTAMFSFSAEGKMVPPMLIYPYLRLPSTIVNSVPDSWVIGHLDSGWMKAEVFYEYIGNVFNTHLETNKIQRPVILFVDGHKSHLSYKLSQLCSELQIILIALYPNATRILQPADVSAFKPIKYGWKKAVLNWRIKNPTDSLTKENVAPILKTVVNEIKPEILVNGFKACGLYPWNSESIDFTKCLGKNQTNVAMYGNRVITLDQFENIIGDETVQKFQNIDEVIAKSCESPLFFTLYRVWEEFSRNDQTLVSRTSHTDNETQPHSSKTVKYQSVSISPNDVTQTQKYDSKLVPIVSKICSTQVQEEILLHTPNDNTLIKNDHTYATPEKKFNDRPIPPSTEPIIDNSIPQVPGCSSQALADVLTWPVTPTRKGKKETERVPYVISSKKWKRLYEENVEKKAAEERIKSEKKRMREQKKLIKDQTMKIKRRKKNPDKTTTAENPSPTDNAIDLGLKPVAKEPSPHKLKGKKMCLTDTKCGLCYTCGTNFKNEKNYKPIECDMCDRVYHIKCAQKSSLDNKDIDENDSLFVCKSCMEFGNEIANDLQLI